MSKLASIPRMPATESVESMASALGDAGCLVVENLLDAEMRERIRDELAPHMLEAEVATETPEDEFYPGHTRRLTALVARSAATHDLIMNPLVEELCKDQLRPNCTDHQLHVGAALEIGPGAREQILHREEDSYTFFPVPRPTLIVATMWALSDFTVANGGTLIVPGSHTWPAERVAVPDEIVAAEMPAGSTLFWLGGTLHGAGANTTKDWRYGIILTYSLGWLRQEENQYLDVPPRLAKELPKALRTRLGLDLYRALGIHDPRVRDGELR